MDEAIESLVAIIDVQKKQVGTSYQNAIAHWCDYKTFWAMGDALWKVLAPMQNRSYVPLAEIDVGEAVYKMAIDRVYEKERPVSPPPPPVSHFEKYIDGLMRKHNTDVGREDAENTRKDVVNIWQSIVSPPSLLGDNGDGDDNGEMTAIENPDEVRRDRGKVFGCIVGRVQSGKTRNYIGLILKAFDEGWNAALVLTSNNTALANQTLERIMNECRNAEVPATQLDFRSGMPNVGFVAGGRYLGLAQKEIHHLSNIGSWLKSLPAEDVGKMRLLVVDDEADNATPDTMQNGDFVDESEIPIIAFSIRRLNPFVAEWIEGLRILDVEARAVELGLVDAERAESFIESVRREVEGAAFIDSLEGHLLNTNGVVAKLIGVDEERDFNGDGQMVRLADMVWHVMNHQRNRRFHPFDNKRTLWALLKYVFGIGATRSRINHSITSLFSFGSDATNRQDAFAFGSMAYVGYTATPYANMLNESPEKDPLAADFMYSMRVSRHYMGLERMFGAPRGKDDDVPNMNIVCELSDKERDVVDAVRNGAEVSSNLVVTWEIDDAEENVHKRREKWETLRAAVVWLFCAAAARRIHRLRTCPMSRKIADRWTTMLFNIGIETDLHEDLRNILENHLRWIMENRENFICDCEEMWRNKSYTRDDFNRDCSDYGSEVENYPLWEDISPHIEWYLDHITDDYGNVHPIVINKTREGQLGLRRYRDETRYLYNTDDHLWIVVGGNTLARGLTLDGLVVTYIDRVRDSSAVDTLEQMGRWFGYREGYELLPRIWMPKDAIAEYKNMSWTESVLHRELAYKYENGCSPKIKGHYAQIIYLGRKLSGRAAAMQINMEIGGSQDTFRQFYATMRDRALDIVRRFVEKLGDQMRRPAQEYKAQGENARHQYHEYPCWKNVPVDQICDFLNEYATIAPPNALSRIKALLYSLNLDAHQSWNVVLSNASGRGLEQREVLISQGIFLKMARATCTKSENGIVEFGKYTGNNYAYFSCIRTADITAGEVAIIRECEYKKDGRLPNGWSQADVESELCRALNAGDEIDAELRVFYGLSRMSDSAQYEKIFSRISHDQIYDAANPVLQLSLIIPSSCEVNAVENFDAPFVAISFYRPGGDNRYWTVSPTLDVDASGHQAGIPTMARLREEIDMMLREYGFLSKSMIRCMLGKKFNIEELSKVAIVEEKSLITKALQGCYGRYAVWEDPIYHTYNPGDAVIYSVAWYEELKYHNSYDVLSVTECIIWQLESEVRQLIEETDGKRLARGAISRGMLTFFPYRKGIVCSGMRQDCFDEMFADMAADGRLSLIHLESEDPSACWVSFDPIQFDGVGDVPLKHKRQEDLDDFIWRYDINNSGL